MLPQLCLVKRKVTFCVTQDRYNKSMQPEACAVSDSAPGGSTATQQLRHHGIIKASTS
jgi:hypothetical protein